MTLEDLQAKLADLPEALSLLEFNQSSITDAIFDRGEWTLLLEPKSIRGSCEFLRSQCGYYMLSNSTAVDWYPSEPRFEVVYHLLCHDRKTRLRLKCKVGGDNPEIDSVTPVWSSADWYEREIFDLFGIRFNGHPHLRRILLPEDWEGHPLRKDFPVTGYR
jgi:NADH-quinone oxidoreductase subunit C